MGSNVKFTKGDYSIGVETNRVDDEYKNKLITLTLATSTSNQSSGKKETKIVDLLRITNQYSIKGYITSVSTANSSKKHDTGGSTAMTAKEIKDALKTIATGAGEDGGVITMTYESDSIEGYIESITFSDVAKDYPSSPSVEMVKYEVQIIFVKGESAI